MARTALAQIVPPVTPKPTRGYYQRILRALVRHQIPCLIGGTFALEEHTGIRRATKDLDLFIEDGRWNEVATALAHEGIPTSLTFPHWLGKAGDGRHFVDLLFASGNGLCRVTSDWFVHAREMRLWGVPALLCPAEELIWSKSFVQERERFDGADVMHLLRAQADRLDWARLLERFGPDWRVLLSHLVTFGFVFPGDRRRIPTDVMDLLIDRLRNDDEAPDPPRLCRGPLLSREQYLVDVEHGGDIDARQIPHGTLSRADLARWTAEVPAARRAVLRNPPRRRNRS